MKAHTRRKGTEPPCKELVIDAMAARMADLKALYRAGDLTANERRNAAHDFGFQIEGDETEDQIMAILDEGKYHYGLSFDYVAPETFDDELEGYWRYQISYGGPEEAVHFYASPSGGRGFTMYRAKFCYLDWYGSAGLSKTGLSVVLGGDARATAEAMFTSFDDTDMLQSTVRYQRKLWKVERMAKRGRMTHPIPIRYTSDTQGNTQGHVLHAAGMHGAGSPVLTGISESAISATQSQKGRRKSAHLKHRIGKGSSIGDIPANESKGDNVWDTLRQFLSDQQEGT